MVTPKRVKQKLPMVQLYDSAPKDMEIDTQYGYITYLRWLELEKARIERTPGRVAEIMHLKNAASLFVNRVVGDPH